MTESSQNAAPIGVETITCPPWCTVDQASHIAGLDTWDGDVLHRGKPLDILGRASLALVSATTPSGVPVETPGVDLFDLGDEPLTEAQAHELGMALVRAADVLRRERVAREAGR